MSAPAFRFACTRCGHCCSGGSGHVWIEEPEIEPMARALGMSAARFAERHLRRVVDPNTGVERLSLREVANEGGRCALLVGKNTCSVYAARPQHCRQFPYWERVLTDPAAFEAARATCPGIAVIVSAEVRARAAGELRALYALIEERCARVRAAGLHCAPWLRDPLRNDPQERFDALRAPGLTCRALARTFRRTTGSSRPPRSGATWSCPGPGRRARRARSRGARVRDWSRATLARRIARRGRRAAPRAPEQANSGRRNDRLRLAQPARRELQDGSSSGGGHRGPCGASPQSVLAVRNARHRSAGWTLGGGPSRSAHARVSPSPKSIHGSCRFLVLCAQAGVAWSRRPGEATCFGWQST